MGPSKLLNISMVANFIVNLARPYYPDTGSNTTLDVSVKVFLR